jgi:hypothetical protein
VLVNEEIKGTLKDDVDSMDDKQKDNLVDNLFTAVMDVVSKKGRGKKTTVDAGFREGIKLSIVAENDTAKTTNRQSARERLNNFGLAETVVKNVTSKLEEGKINSNHISDIRKTNLLDEITALDQDSQQEAVEEIINTRNERDLINSEHISWLVLKKGKINTFLVENWYRGILRTIERLALQADVSRDVVDALLPEQNQHLLQRIKFLINKLENLLTLLERK